MQKQGDPDNVNRNFLLYTVNSWMAAGLFLKLRGMYIDHLVNEGKVLKEKARQIFTHFN